MPHELTKNKKLVILKCLLILRDNNEPISQSDCDESGFDITTGDNHLSGWIEKKPKALPKAKLAP